MSSALAISGVTAVVEYLLNSVYSSSGLGSVAVSAVAPDIIQGTLGTGSAAPLQVNLFLHQVTPNAPWRNEGLPSVNANGTTQLSTPPLALDLHYLLTAYANEDLMAEALLGYGIQLIHQTPVLPRSQIRTALAGVSPTNPLASLLGSSGLAEQFEMLKITPATLGREELAWLWNALKADYRPTFPFQVSVVLIQPPGPSPSALPSLRQQISLQPSMLLSSPTLTAANPPNGQPAACIGDTVTVAGAILSGVTAVVLENSRLGIQQTVTGLSAVGNTSFQFIVPDVPAGVYLLSAQALVESNTVTSSGVPLAIAPRINASWAPGSIAGGANVAINNVPCTPAIRVGQQASLLIGGQEGLAHPFTAPTNSPSFTFANLQATGHPVPVRLRVDGIDSPIIDMTKSPPVFTGPSVQVT